MVCWWYVGIQWRRHSIVHTQTASHQKGNCFYRFAVAFLTHFTSISMVLIIFSGWHLWFVAKILWYDQICFGFEFDFLRLPKKKIFAKKHLFSPFYCNFSTKFTPIICWLDLHFHFARMRELFKTTFLGCIAIFSHRYHVILMEGLHSHLLIFTTTKTDSSQLNGFH